MDKTNAVRLALSRAVNQTQPANHRETAGTCGRGCTAVGKCSSLSDRTVTKPEPAGDRRDRTLLKTPEVDSLAADSTEVQGGAVDFRL